MVEIRHEILFAENSDIDPEELNALFRLVGWDNQNRRTVSETRVMLDATHFYVHAHVNRKLVGFARVCGDPYVAQVLDVITHPEYRYHGIATECMHRIASFLSQSNYVTVTLLDDSGIPCFYERFGFRGIGEAPMKWCS